MRWHYQWIVDARLPADGSSAARPADAGAPASRACTAVLHVGDRAVHAGRVLGRGVSASGTAWSATDYDLNDGQHEVPIFDAAVRDASCTSAASAGCPPRSTIEWKHFFATAATRAAEQHADRPQPRHRARRTCRPDRAALVALNLRRGQALGLPAGPDVARAMGETPLGDDDAAQAAEGEDRRAHARDAAERDAALVLRPARGRGPGGRRAAGAGRRADRRRGALGLLEGDPQSYVRQWPAWRPELSARRRSFTMADLVRFTQRPV